VRNQPSYLHEIYEFEGTPYEIGYERGKRTADLLKLVLESYPANYTLDYFKEKKPSEYNEWKKVLDKAPEWILEEARGNAEGAGVPFEKLIIQDGWFPFKTEDTEGCCGFVAFGKGTVGGRVLVGGNGETDHASIRYLGVARFKNKNGNNLVMQSKRPWEPGTQCGVNEKGVSLFGSGISVIPEAYGTVGYGSTIIRRRVLQEANDLDEAIDIFKKGPLLTGHHMYVGDEKRAVHIEYTCDHLEVIDPEKGFEAGASSAFSSPNLKDYAFTIKDVFDPKFLHRNSLWSGMWRIGRFHDLFEELKPLTLEMIPRILGDHGGRGSGQIREDMEGVCPQGSDYTICVHGSRIGKGKGALFGGPTTGSFHSSGFSNIEVPDQRKMYIAFGSPCECGYVSFYPPK
jgi:hypothetical protein